MLIELALGWWLATGPTAAWAQKAAPAPAEPAAEAEAAPAEGAAEEAPAEQASPRKKPGRKGKSAGADPFQIRVAEIAKVWRGQIAFGKAEFDAWNEFWTAIRNDRGKFEQRLTAERAAFVDSLKSLDSKDHGQSLLDFETMQSNKMKAFEESQGAKIKDFIQQREARLREFGIAQEAERERLAQASVDSWMEERSFLNIALPPPDVRPSKKDRSKDKGDKKDKKKSKSDDDW
ncbi:MAG: hypothetical protein HY748_04910 [Elusimicrobia bacterium]|nr:hypothetical protein [Elusimicrobiota bacterium]